VYDDEILRTRPLFWLLNEDLEIAKHEYQAQVVSRVNMEVAMSRVLAIAFGGKNQPVQPPYPTWEEFQSQVREQMAAEQQGEPDWWTQYKAANWLE